MTAAVRINIRFLSGIQTRNIWFLEFKISHTTTVFDYYVICRSFKNFNEVSSAIKLQHFPGSSLLRS